MVPLNKLSKGDVYTLSQPAPDWSQIDPYSSLEETYESDCKTSEPNTFAKKSRMHLETVLSIFKQLQTKLHRSRRCTRQTVYREFSDTCNSDSDSDYRPILKTTRNQNVGLCAPSSTRLWAQEIIRSAKERSQVARNKLPTLPEDKTRDKRCPYCSITFYYSEGVCTHIDHAHKDIVSMKGIINYDTETPEPAVEGDVKGTNTQASVPIVEGHMWRAQTFQIRNQ